MSTALTTAKAIAEHFALTQETLAAGILTDLEGDGSGVGVLQSISADIDRAGVAMTDVINTHKDDPDVFLPFIYAKAIELGECVVYRLSVLLDGKMDPPAHLMDAHLYAVLALAMAQDYLTNGEVCHEPAVGY